MISRSARSNIEDFCNSCVRHNVQRIGDLSVLQTLLSADATPFVGHVSLGLCVVDQRPLVFVAVQVASDCAQRSIRKDELQELAEEARRCLTRGRSCVLGFDHGPRRQTATCIKQCWPPLLSHVLWMVCQLCFLRRWCPASPVRVS